MKSRKGARGGRNTHLISPVSSNSQILDHISTGIPLNGGKATQGSSLQEVFHSFDFNVKAGLALFGRRDGSQSSCSIVLDVRRPVEGLNYTWIYLSLTAILLPSAHANTCEDTEPLHKKFVTGDSQADREHAA